MSGLVGLSVNWLRFSESQMDFRLSVADDNQSRFRSPTKTNSPEFNPATKLFKELRASLQAEQGP